MSTKDLKTEQPCTLHSVSGSNNFYDNIRALCPKDSDVYFDDSIQSITVILDRFKNKAEVDRIQSKIHSYISNKMLQDSFRTVKVMW
jgi:hypothetical protein